MSRPKLVDLFCGAGGSSMGYHQAGFEVTGVDIRPQPRYPFAFVQADALEYVAEHGHRYAAIAASPPCQAYTILGNLYQDRTYPDLLGPMVERLRAWGGPWIVENVDRAPFPRDLPVIQLCGSSMGCWRLRRHRWFAGAVPTLVPGCEHWRWAGHPPIGVHGHGTDGWLARKGYRFTQAERQRAMGIDWMNRDELAQAIPPAFTRYLGAFLLGAVRERVA